MRQLIAKIHSQEEGATAAEYVFLLIFVAIIVSVAMAVLGGDIATLFTDTGDAIDATTVGTTGN